jgi:hypothetical protein
VSAVSLANKAKGHGSELGSQQPIYRGLQAENMGKKLIGLKSSKAWEITIKLGHDGGA